MTTRYNNKLVILRGNSGCGKSSTAKMLREKVDGKLAIVEQDHIRRDVLDETGENQSANNIDLIEQTVEFALSHKYDVILEGILTAEKYGDMIKRLIQKTPNHFFTTLIYRSRKPFIATLTNWRQTTLENGR